MARVDKNDLYLYEELRTEIINAYERQRISYDEKTKMECFLHECVFKQDQFPSDELVQIADKIWIDGEAII